MALSIRSRDAGPAVNVEETIRSVPTDSPGLPIWRMSWRWEPWNSPASANARPWRGPKMSTGVTPDGPGHRHRLRRDGGATPPGGGDHVAHDRRSGRRTTADPDLVPLGWRDYPDLQSAESRQGSEHHGEPEGRVELQLGRARRQRRRVHRPGPDR